MFGNRRASIKEIVEARQRLEVNVERAMQQVEKRRRFRLGGQGWEGGGANR